MTHKHLLSKGASGGLAALLLVFACGCATKHPVEGTHVGTPSDPKPVVPTPKSTVPTIVGYELWTSGKDGTRYGVVYIKECFSPDRNERINMFHTEIAMLRHKSKARIDALDKVLSNRREETNALPKDSGHYRELYKVHQNVENQLIKSIEHSQSRLRKKSNDIILTAYNEILKVIEKIGREQNYNLIYQVGEPGIGDETPLSVKQQTKERVIIYQDTTIDITDEVIKRLNQAGP